MAIVNTQIPTYLNDISNARREKGYSQKSFAGLVGVSPSRYNRLERGKIGLSAKMLAKICDELDLVIRLEKRV